MRELRLKTICPEPPGQGWIMIQTQLCLIPSPQSSQLLGPLLGAKAEAMGSKHGEGTGALWSSAQLSSPPAARQARVPFVRAQHLVVKCRLARVHHLAPLGPVKHCRRSRWGRQAPGGACLPDVHQGRFKIKGDGRDLTSLCLSVHPDLFPLPLLSPLSASPSPSRCLFLRKMNK